MQYSFVAAGLLALTSSVFAQVAGFDPITNPTQDQEVAPGSSLDVIWQPTAKYASENITIKLLEGSDFAHLQIGDVLATLPNTAAKFTWAVPEAKFATYGFMISLVSDSTIFQYSFPFHISGSSSSSGSATGSATSTKTMTLSPGPSYTASSSTTANSTITSTSSTASTAKPTNGTLSTTHTLTTSSTKTTAPTTSTTSTPAAATSTGAAMANIVSGGVAAFGGLLLAFAL